HDAVHAGVVQRFHHVDAFAVEYAHTHANTSLSNLSGITLIASWRCGASPRRCRNSLASRRMLDSPVSIRSTNALSALRTPTICSRLTPRTSATIGSEPA